MNAKIKKLLNKHPLKETIVEVTLESWKQIFDSKIGNYQIGKDIFPSPQILSFFLHELIAHNLSLMNSDFRVGIHKEEKDIHCISNSTLGIEIKGSSNRKSIFANRSYAQKSSPNEIKNKDGYYLAINFEKISVDNPTPKITMIRFGYLVHSDWIAQTAATGQQARLSPETYKNKFEVLYSVDSKHY